MRTMLQKVCLLASQQVTAAYPDPHQEDLISAVTGGHKLERTMLSSSFVENKTKTRGQNRASIEKPVLPSKQSKACAKRGIFQCTPHNSFPKMTWFTAPRRISTFSPQHALPPGQLKGLFKHQQANKKTLRRQGKSCGGPSELCIFIAQTHRPMLILLNHMHTLARQLLRTFSGTQPEWL